MKIVGIEVINQLLEDKTANGINFGCSKKNGVPVITKTCSPITTINWRFVSVQKNWKIIFEDLTDINLISSRLKSKNTLYTSLGKQGCL